MYRGREFSVEGLLSDSLANPKADLLFLVGSPEQLPENLSTDIQTIWLSDQAFQSSVPFEAGITLHAGRWGLDHAGSGCRADGVPIQRAAIGQSGAQAMGPSSAMDLLNRLSELAQASLR